MIRRKNECKVDYREHMRGGDGTVIMTNLITGPEEMYGKGRLFSRITVQPGCSIGFHIHEGDSEIYYILTGTGVYSDNGTEVIVNAGDVTFCPPGTGHGMANKSDEVLEIMAVIVYE